MPSLDYPIHNHALVQKLHLAHADYLQEYCKYDTEITGRAYYKKGNNRTFFVNNLSMKNRIILMGDEPPELIDELIKWYDKYDAEACNIEINPSNLYTSTQREYPPKLMDLLIQRGFFVSSFRTVWVCLPEVSKIELPNDITIKRFESDEMDAFIEDLNVVNKIVDEEQAKARDDEIRRDEGSDHWIHYIAYIDEIASATATLFITEDVGYLAWGYTRRQARNQGLHGYLINERVNDSALRGCSLSFSVTNFNDQSSMNLQRLEFRLAYNYIRLLKKLK